MNLAFLARYQEPVRERLAAVLQGVDPIRPILRYHVGIENRRGKPEVRTGKMLRPCLTLFMAEQLGGDEGRSLHAAVALELVHNFSLIHDDIEDNDKLRRGHPAVWDLIGVPKAINAGDLMITLALLEGSEAGAEEVRCLLEAMRDMVDGQALDLEYESQWTSAEEYRAMILLKTGALFRCACELAGIVSAQDEETIRRLGAFGEELGLLFQIRDDVLGIWGTEAVLGRKPGSDLKKKKKSYPLVAAHQLADDADQKALHQALGITEKSAPNVEAIIELLNRLGIRAEAEVQIREHKTRAEHHLGALPIDTAAKDVLLELLSQLEATAAADPGALAS